MPNTQRQLSGWTPASTIEALCLLCCLQLQSALAPCCLLSVVYYLLTKHILESNAASGCLRIAGSASALSCHYGYCVTV